MATCKEMEKPGQTVPDSIRAEGQHQPTHGGLVVVLRWRIAGGDGPRAARDERISLPRAKNGPQTPVVLCFCFPPPPLPWLDLLIRPFLSPWCGWVVFGASDQGKTAAAAATDGESLGAKTGRRGVPGHIAFLMGLAPISAERKTSGERNGH